MCLLERYSIALDRKPRNRKKAKNWKDELFGTVWSLPGWFSLCDPYLGGSHCESPMVVFLLLLNTNASIARTIITSRSCTLRNTSSVCRRYWYRQPAALRRIALWGTGGHWHMHCLELFGRLHSVIRVMNTHLIKRCREILHRSFDHLIGRRASGTTRPADLSLSSVRGEVS